MKREAFHHPKMLDLASRLGISRTHACGIVGNLWNWAADTAPQGNIGKWPDGAIALACDWPGDAAEFVEILTCSGWLDHCSEHRLVIHDLEDHAPEWLKTKIKRTHKPFLRAAIDTQVPGANVRNERSPTGGASLPLFSALETSTLDIPASAGCAAASKSKPAAPKVEASGYEFPTRGKQQVYSLPASKLAEYRESFPGMDVDQEIRVALQWCRDNEARRKTAAGMPAFLSRWLGRACNSGGSGATGPPRTTVARPSIDKSAFEDDSP